MTNREELEALAERCERAEGADVALDSDICRAIFGRSSLEEPADDPLYTASLDAAMGLVPEGAYRSFGQGDGPAWAVVSLGDDNEPTSDGATPALAMTAAALRARAAGEQ